MPVGGLTRRVLQRIHFQDLESAIEFHGTFSIESSGKPQFPPEIEDFVPKVLRRRGLPDLVYARLSHEYVRALESGCRNPATEIAQRHHEPVKRIQDRIRMARRRGFLSPGVQGRPGGKLTARARRLLRSRRA